MPPLTDCRYVEADAVRAELVSRAEDWPACGLYTRRHGGKPFTLADWPVRRPHNWTTAGNASLEEKQLEPLRIGVNRRRPCGNDDWVRTTANRLGLELTPRNTR